VNLYCFGRSPTRFAPAGFVNNRVARHLFARNEKYFPLLLQIISRLRRTIEIEQKLLAWMAPGARAVPPPTPLPNFW
jgi:hypothetical protein